LVGRKKKDYNEPHLAPNEKMQPIQWTEWPIGVNWWLLVHSGQLDVVIAICIIGYHTMQTAHINPD